MKKIVLNIILFLWTALSLGQDIRYFEKPFKLSDLPNSFISIDTAYYRGLTKHQAIQDSLIHKQKEKIILLLDNIKLLELQKTKFLSVIENKDEQIKIYKDIDLKKDKTIKNLNRKNKITIFSSIAIILIILII